MKSRFAGREDADFIPIPSLGRQSEIRGRISALLFLFRQLTWAWYRDTMCTYLLNTFLQRSLVDEKNEDHMQKCI